MGNWIVDALMDMKVIPITNVLRYLGVPANVVHVELTQFAQLETRMRQSVHVKSSSSEIHIQTVDANLSVLMTTIAHQIRLVSTLNALTHVLVPVVWRHIVR